MIIYKENEKMEMEKYVEFPKVSIITINFNGASVTCDLIESLRNVTYPNFEVIVVDNASQENPDIIKERYPEVVLIKNKENLGFAGGNNAGFRAASGKYFMLLNNDTEVHPEFLHPLVARLESDPLAGAVSSKLIYHNTDGIIQYAGSSMINPYTGRSSFLGQKEKDQGQYDVCCQTHYAHGAAMMVPRRVVEEVGLMADLYFLYYEELDFCERIKEAGYAIWYIGTSVVYHKESMSVGKQNPIKTYYMTRNRLVYMRRNVRGIKLFISMLYFTVIAMPKHTLSHLAARRKDLLKAFYRGVAWNLTNHKIFGNPKI
ncbi:glycosyltransferase family 2 protein [Cytophagaceae bacterium ABcell3]|nr:glycosyltransferase family 2 protein [Cytophagaceae bacterium ABcell3]